MLKVLLWKNCILRKRHYLLTCVEIFTATALFLLISFIRSKIPNLSKTYINETTTLNALPISEIYSRINIRDFQLYYAPKTVFTDKLIREVQLKLNLYNDGKSFYWNFYNFK